MIKARYPGGKLWRLFQGRRNSMCKDKEAGGSRESWKNRSKSGMASPHQPDNHGVRTEGQRGKIPHVTQMPRSVKTSIELLFMNAY